jgi:hypothetical protein
VVLLLAGFITWAGSTLKVCLDSLEGVGDDMLYNRPINKECERRPVKKRAFKSNKRDDGQ